jgi:hypothetical protein
MCSFRLAYDDKFLSKINSCIVLQRFVQKNTIMCKVKLFPMKWYWYTVTHERMKDFELVSVFLELRNN